MKLAALLAAFAGMCWGQTHPGIDPEAEKLYRRASVALHQLPAYEMDVETTLIKPRGVPGEGFHILAKIAARQPDHILISGSTPFFGESTVYSDGHSSLFWQESTNQFAKIDAAIPARLLMHLTNLTPEAEPVEQTLISAKVLRSEEIDLDGERFDCRVIEVVTAGREGVQGDPTPRTLWIDTKTGVALRQQTDVVPPLFDKEIPARIEVTRFHTGAYVDNGDFSFIVPADATEVDWKMLDMAMTNRMLVGREVPPLHLVTSDGHPLDLTKLRGKPVLLHFQAAWCKPCEESTATLDSVAKVMGPDVRILQVDVDETPEGVRGGAARTTASRHPVAVVSADDLEALGLRAWPANLLISREGKILSFDAGRASEAALLALLRNAVLTTAAPPPLTWGALEPHHASRGFNKKDELTPPELVYKVDAGYTPEAQKAKISGTVMLAILVGTDGLVSDIHVLERLEPSLEARAITAVSKWRFKPAMRGTTAVAFRARAGVSFSQQ